MARPHTTIAIPCYNGGRHLCGLLGSLLYQDDQGFRLLLVDDGSTDDSAALARDIAGDRIEIHHNGRQTGIGTNWNRCMELIDTEFFCIAHMDDLYRPGYLGRMAQELREHPEAGMAHCRADVIDENNDLYESNVERFKDAFWQRSRDWTPAEQFPLLTRGNYIVCPSVIYRTQACREIGSFREDLSFALDWDYSFRMMLAGWHVRGVSNRLMAYRRHRASATMEEQRSLRRYAEELEIQRKHCAAGVTAGLLRERHSASPALRRNVIYTAYEDLAAGDRDGARAKLEFLRTNAPADWRHPMTQLFRLGTALGAPGHRAMGLALKGALWWHNRGGEHEV